MNTAHFIASFRDIFRCPLCFAPMNAANDGKSFVCPNKHCFDLAKRGYINLLPRPVATKYDKQLFESRRAIGASGFWKPVDAYISEQIIHALGTKCDTAKVLDAGCGEGSHLSGIKKIIARATGKDVLGVGLDISKEAIVLAAKNDADSIWCAADLAKCPLADKQFDFILNILSPSNYSEFQRLFKGGGKLIKVIPGSSYLQELRALFYDQTGKQAYSNRDTQERFGMHFELLETKRLHYKAHLRQPLIEHLVRMTPLTWGARAERLQRVRAMEIMEVTIDLTVLVGKKRG